MPATTHPSFGAVSYTSEQLSDDADLATARTIEVMVRYIREDAGAPAIRAALADAVRGSSRRWPEAIFTWIQEHVRFATDARTAEGMQHRPAEPYDIELLIRPVDLLRMRPPTGDCDDFSMLTAAMLLTAGIDCELVTIAADPQQPGVFSHVYVEALLPGGVRVPMDTSHGRYPGWEYPDAARKRTWPITGGKTLEGLSAIDWNRLIQSSVDAGTKIATARYGQPPVGTYIQTGDSVLYRQQPGASALNFPTVGLTGSSTSTVLIVGVIAVAALFALSRR